MQNNTELDWPQYDWSYKGVRNIINLSIGPKRMNWSTFKSWKSAYETDASRPLLLMWHCLSCMTSMSPMLYKQLRIELTRLRLNTRYLNMNNIIIVWISQSFTKSLNIKYIIFRSMVECDPLFSTYSIWEWFLHPTHNAFLKPFSNIFSVGHNNSLSTINDPQFTNIYLPQAIYIVFSKQKTTICFI